MTPEEEAIMQASKEDAQNDSLHPEEEERLPFTPKHKPKSTRYTEADEGLKEETSPVEAFDVKVAAECAKAAFEGARTGTPEMVEIAPGVKLPRLNEKSLDGTLGLLKDGTLGIVEEKTGFDGKSRKVFSWISDCIVFITKDTQSDGKTEFTIEGVGAKNQRRIKITLSADVVGNGQQFKTALIHAFGALNRFGEMNWEYLQDLTFKAGNVREIKRIEVPCWRDNVPMIPGAYLSANAEYRLSPTVPAEVHDGDLEEAKEVLRDLLNSHEYAPIMIAHVLGAPAVARWRPDDRVAVALWGFTGTLKTTFAKHCLAMFGTEYESDRYLIKSGSSGATDVALGLAYAAAGILPTILDNVKVVDLRDIERYVRVIHAVIEGTDKLRGTKDAKLKDTLTFLCSLVITGEVRPEESSTDARVLNLTWTKPDIGLLRQVEEDMVLLPVIGYHWLKYLTQTPDDMIDGFSEDRAKYEKEFANKGIVNPGRLATIYTVLRFTWDQLLRSPLGDVFEEFTDDFVEALDEAVEVQGDIVSNDTEASKFMNALSALIASQPQRWQPEGISGTCDGYILGKHCEDGLFVLPELILAEMEKLHIFTQHPNVDSMTKALAAKGVLVKADFKSHKGWRAHRRINGSKVYGWLIRIVELEESIPGNPADRQQATLGLLGTPGILANSNT